MFLAAAISTSILLVSCALLLFPVLFTCLFNKRKKQSITKRTTLASRKQEKLKKTEKTQSKSGKTKTDEGADGSKKKKQKTAEATTALSIMAGKKKKDGGKKEAREKPNREEKKVLKKQPPKQQDEPLPMDIAPEAAGKTKFTIPSCMMSTVPTAEEEDYPDELHQQLMKHPEMVVC